MTQFDKSALTASEQLDLLIERGLKVHDLERALRLLEVTTSFRLSPYMRPFQYPDDPAHSFKPGTQLSEIMQVYRFDSDLRQLVMVAIERVEIAVRTGISNHMACQYGTHWYLSPARFKSHFDHARLLKELGDKLAKEARQYHKEVERIENAKSSEEIKMLRKESRKRDNYPRYYSLTYDQPVHLPSWAMVEELSLGSLSHLFDGLDEYRDRKAIARRFAVPHQVLASWLHTLTFIRNICAHHFRLWNRELSIPPSWPKHLTLPGPQKGGGVPRRLFTVLAMLTYLTTQISPDTRWPGRLHALLEEYSDIPRAPMGFPDDWQPRLASLNAATR
ncbi:Abi family protein [Aidingimonas lacisalsi]|uniref:Abi family protein n=1 Tax=Aidingimonas lacisalsi TaxID=2604086 RepID=UPI0011D19396|nr:Abi family protein [Aidingimonas lacisalsi]